MNYIEEEYGIELPHTICADKYKVREYLEREIEKSIGQIQFFFKTENWRDITLENSPDDPCVVKSNHTLYDVRIVRDKTIIDIKKLQVDCRWALNKKIYPYTSENQYKYVNPKIIIEKPFEKSDVYIPNNYKLLFLNGKLEFVYYSVYREGINKRNSFYADWNPLILAGLAFM